MKGSILLLGAALTLASAPAVFAHGQQGQTGHQQLNGKKVSLDSIPQKARQALLKEAKGSPIASVERQNKNGQTLYEGRFRQNGAMMGVTVDENGNVISRTPAKAAQRGKFGGQKSAQK